MSIKLWIFIITSVALYNIYYDTNILSKMKNYKKYYKMGLVIIMGAGFLHIVNKSPKMSYQNMKSVHDFIQVMPIDRQSKDLISPFFSMSSEERSSHIIMESGKKSSKRSVSETKKKYVAAQQGWKCKHCQTELSAWFEVDHKVRLEYGGTNEVSNLEALCRECHGKKTAMENM